MSESAKNPADRLPPQTKFIVGNEACERFSYYGVRSILAGYITGEVLKGGLGQSVDTSTSIIHLFIFANYFMPLLGAWLSDKLIGRYYTILYVSLFYCAGHGVLACSDFFTTPDSKLYCLYAGLALIAFGSGGIKPCVSAFMGDQFKPEQGHLLQKAYGAFYWAINFGSFFSFLVIPWIKNHVGYSWAFGVPGIAMAVATLIFWIGTRHYVRIPAPGDPGWVWKVLSVVGLVALFFGCQFAHGLLIMVVPPIMANTAAITGFVVPVLCVVLFGTVRLHRRLREVRERREGGFTVVTWYALTRVFSRRPGQRFWDPAREKFTDASVDAAATVPPILSIFALIPAFWALFDQTNSTWVLQGQKMTPIQLPIPFTKWIWTLGAEEMQSANPALVMILVPILTLLVYPMVGRLASPLRRMSAGMFLGAGSYVIVAWLQGRLETGAQLSVAWQVLPYVVLTAGEVLLSATGLEFAFAESAKEMRSTIMSFWLLTVAVGNLMVSIITKCFAGGGEEAGHAASVSSDRFFLYAGLTAVVAVLFSVVATFYRYRHPSYQK